MRLSVIHTLLHAIGRRRALSLSALALVATVLATPAASAHAAARGNTGAAPAGSASTPVTSGLVPVYDPMTRASRMATPEAAPAVIAAYWTPARMAAARPVALDTLKTAPALDTRPDGVPRLIANPTPPVAAPGQLHPNVAFTNTDGKVFFRNPVDGIDYQCSGSAVNSSKRRLVLTAGHCVHQGGGGGWMQNWKFDPGYESGAVGSPGTFTIFQPWVQSAWINNDDHHYDYAFVITKNGSHGGRLVDTVGGNGLIVNPGRPFVTFIGYPDNVSNAQVQAFCQGQLSRRSVFISDQQLDCSIGDGSSGGPWLENYSNANGLGIAVSNTSYGINPDPQGPVFGPYYDGDTAALFNTADNASP